MKSMYDYLANEEHRWGYMTEEQMVRRIRRITIPEKLMATIHVAISEGASFAIRNEIRDAVIKIRSSNKSPRSIQDLSELFVSNYGPIYYQESIAVPEPIAQVVHHQEQHRVIRFGI